MNKKIFWPIIILLILIIGGVATFLIWPGLKIELPEPEIKIVKIARGTPMPFFIATEMGFFEEENLQPDFVIKYLDDPTLALLTGEVDYATARGLLTTPLVKESLKGAPIKTIMLTARHQPFWLLAQPGLELNNIETIGIIAKHTPQHYQLLKIIEENGLKVEIITLEPGAKSWLAEFQNLLRQGKVDAILHSSPTLGVPSKEEFSVLVKIIDITPSILIVRNDKIEKNPEEVQKIIRVMEKTMDFMITKPKKTEELLLKYMIEDLKFEETEEAIAIVKEELYPFVKTAYDRRNIPYDEGAEFLIQVIKAGEFETLEEVEKQVVTQEELDKVFDFRFVK